MLDITDFLKHLALCSDIPLWPGHQRYKSIRSGHLYHQFWSTFLGLGRYFISVMIQPNCECWEWMGLLLFYHPRPICQQSDQIILSNPLIIQKFKQQDWVTSSAFSTWLSHLMLKQTLCIDCAWLFDLIFMPHPLLMTTINPFNPIVSSLNNFSVHSCQALQRVQYNDFPLVSCFPIPSN